LHYAESVVSGQYIRLLKTGDFYPTLNKLNKLFDFKMETENQAGKAQTRNWESLPFLSENKNTNSP
jgi:hypothetical protein